MNFKANQTADDDIFSNFSFEQFNWISRKPPFTIDGWLCHYMTSAVSPFFQKCNATDRVTAHKFSHGIGMDSLDLV